MIDPFSRSVGLVEGYLMGKDAPGAIIDALQVLKVCQPVKTYTRDFEVKTTEPCKDEIEAPEKIVMPRDYRPASLSEPDTREEREDAPIRKPRKPFSPQELERRRKQLAEARAKRKKKSDAKSDAKPNTKPAKAFRDPNTKDMFAEKN